MRDGQLGKGMSSGEDDFVMSGRSLWVGGRSRESCERKVL